MTDTDPEAGQDRAWLLAQLRDQDARYNAPGHTRFPLYPMAAGEIEALAADVAALRARQDRLECMWRYQLKARRQERARAEKAEAERDALREAVKQCARGDLTTTEKSRIARATLTAPSRPTEKPRP